MPVIEAPIREQPIQMSYHDAPNAGPEALAISASGINMRGGLDFMEEEVSESEVDKPMTLDHARKKSFGFIQIWGRDEKQDKTEANEDSIVLACASMWLAGFDGKDPELQRKTGKEILSRIVSPDDAIPVPYGPHKYLVLVETDLDPETWLRRIVEAQTEPIKENFPWLGNVPEQLQQKREQELLNLPDGSRPFVDAFYHKTIDPQRAFKGNGEDFFAWEYVLGKDGKLYAVNPDNELQALEDLIQGSVLDETALLMKDIRDYLKVNRGRKRIAIQFDFGEDAACSNIAINAQQSTSELTAGLNLGILRSNFHIPSVTQQISQSILPYPDKTYGSEEYCQKCKKNKTENKCGCEEKSN